MNTLLDLSDPRRISSEHVRQLVALFIGDSGNAIGWNNEVTDNFVNIYGNHILSAVTVTIELWNEVIICISRSFRERMNNRDAVRWRDEVTGMFARRFEERGRPGMSHRW